MLDQNTSDALDLSLVHTAEDALTRGDNKLLLAVILTVTVYVLRTHMLAKVPPSWGRVGAALRWLGSTDRGGVVSSVLIAGLGATATALEAGKVTWAAALNTFVVAAMASGLSTWQKKLKPSRAPLSQPPIDETPLPEPVVAVEPEAAPVVEPVAKAKPKKKRAPSKPRKKKVAP